MPYRLRADLRVVPVLDAGAEVFGHCIVEIDDDLEITPPTYQGGSPYFQRKTPDCEVDYTLVQALERGYARLIGYTGDIELGIDIEAYPNWRAITATRGV